MTIEQIYDYVLFLSNKDEKSGDVVPDDFNNIINAVNLELVEFEWALLMSTVKMTGTSLERLLYNNNFLNLFTVTETVPVINDNLIDYEPDFFKLIKLLQVSPTIVDIELVNEIDLARRRAGVADRAINLHPVCVLREEGIHIFPAYPATKPGYDIEVTYVRMPQTPFYDYYIDSNDVRKYFAEDDWAIWDSGSSSWKIYSANVLIASNCRYPNARNTQESNFSLSLELEWWEGAHIRFINRVLEKMGIPLSQADLEQYSQMEQQKGE